MHAGNVPFNPVCTCQHHFPVGDNCVSRGPVRATSLKFILMCPHVEKSLLDAMMGGEKIGGAWVVAAVSSGGAVTATVVVVVVVDGGGGDVFGTLDAVSIAAERMGMLLVALHGNVQQP